MLPDDPPPEPPEPPDLPESSEPVESSEPGDPRRPSRRKAALVITPIIVLLIGNQIGNALWPTLVNDHPLLLITLSPSNRFFVLTSEKVDPLSFYTVGTLRLLAPDPFFFLLGRWYGDAAIVWMERRTPTYGQMMRSLERWFRKASWPIVVAIPNNPVSLLAGAAGMAVVTFALLDVIGTIGRLVLLRLLGRTFTNPINWFTDLVAQYRWPLLALSIAFVGLSSLREWRAGTSQIEQLIELEEELDAPED